MRISNLILWLTKQTNKEVDKYKTSLEQANRNRLNLQQQPYESEYDYYERLKEVKNRNIIQYYINNMQQIKHLNNLKINLMNYTMMKHLKKIIIIIYYGIFYFRKIENGYII